MRRIVAQGRLERVSERRMGENGKPVIAYRRVQSEE